ncbi:hypothetical protein LCGC14_2844180, partial [marine sediment metagenome]
RPFTLIGATTRAGLLSAPLRDRFQMREHLDFYSVDELAEIAARSAKKLRMPLDEKSAREIAVRSRGTPRLANNRLRWVRDYATSTAGGKVTFRIVLGGTERRRGPVTVSARVVGVDGRRAAGRAEATIQAGGAGADLTVRVRGAKLWTPLQPNLYRAELTGRLGPKICDRVAFRFGMRRIHVRRGRYRLNGKPLWFRGSNLVFEWQWGGPGGIFNRNVKRYLIDEARRMNLNCFRTHTIPPPAQWLDVADEHGMMIWAELPVLYNNRNFKFTPAEFEVFHKHALLDSAGWVTKLWNHPSVAMWVLSNESRDDNKWESGPFYERLAGMVVAHGFNAVLKPDAWCASHVADHCVKHKNESKSVRRKLKKKATSGRKR